MAGASFAYSAANLVSIFRLMGSLASLDNSDAALSHVDAPVMPSIIKLTPFSISVVESVSAVMNSGGRSGSAALAELVAIAAALALASGALDAETAADGALDSLAAVVEGVVTV
jgi:hypothetical protein